MLTCSTEHRGREDTDLRGNLQGPWGERAQERHPPMHMELVGLHSDNHCPLHNTQHTNKAYQWLHCCPRSHSKCGWVERRGWGHFKGWVRIRGWRWNEGRSLGPKIGCAVGGWWLPPDLPLYLHFLPLVRRILHLHMCVHADTKRERWSHTWLAGHNMQRTPHSNIINTC